jgi:hypothetical protein
MVADIGIVSFQKFDNLLQTYYTNTTTDHTKIKSLYPILNDGRSIFTIDTNRSIDFNIESYIQNITPWLPFVKGLFVESKQANELQNSSIASLIDNKYVILDIVPIPIESTEEYMALRDDFIKRSHIGRLIVAPPDRIMYQPQMMKNLSIFLQSGTSQYHITAYDTIIIKSLPYTLYRITSFTSHHQDDLVRPWTAHNSIQKVDTTSSAYIKDILYNAKIISPSKSNKDIIYVDKRKSSDYTLGIWSDTLIWSYNTTGSSYKIDLWTIPRSAIVHLPDLPWWQASGLSGQSVHITHGISEAIVTGTGNILISYHRTSVMIWSYIISFICFMGYIWMIIHSYRKRK